MTRTCATLFSGGGLAEIGLTQAGYTPIWGVEYDAAIAGVYRRNHGDHLIVGDVRGVDFAHLARPDLLWLSPPCPSFSVAKAGRGETATDREIAAACVRAIDALRPRAVILENVRGYQDSESYRVIRAALDRLDYWSHAAVINAADLGVPQTRERLILRAVAGGWMQPYRPWPAPVPWRGWYEAIEDLIPSLPDSAFAPWQLARLPEEIRESVLAMNLIGRRPVSYSRAFILDGQESSAAAGVTVRHGDAPCFTVTAGTGTKRGVRAWLVTNLKQTINGQATLRADNDPATTVIASAKDRPNWTDRIYLPPGRVVALTPRPLARLQGVPNTYWLPDRKSLACRIIGNGVAVAVARAAAETVR